MKVCKQCGCVNRSKASLCRSCDTPFAEAQPAAERPLDSGSSLFTLAAWYSLIVPLLTAGFTISVMFFDYQLNKNNQPFNTPIIEPSLLFGSAAWILVSSVVMGIVSLFGIPRHGAKVILWKALIGIVWSFFFGYFALLFLYLSGLRC